MYYLFFLSSYCAKSAQRFNIFCPLRSIRCYYVHSGLIRSIQYYSVHSVLFISIRSYLVHFSPYVYFSLIQSNLVIIGPLWSYSVLFDRSIQSIMSTLVLLSPFGSTLILFGPIWSIVSTLVLFDLIRSILVLFFYFNHSVYFGLLLSIWVHFGPLSDFYTLLCTFIMGKARFGLRAHLLNPTLL